MDANKTPRLQQAVKLFGVSSIIPVDVFQAPVIVGLTKVAGVVTTYFGYCPPGSTKAQAVWMIKRITETDIIGGVDTDTKWAKNSVSGEKQADDLVFDSGSSEYAGYIYEY